jgi:hypothetical protein
MSEPTTSYHYTAKYVKKDGTIKEHNRTIKYKPKKPKLTDETIQAILEDYNNGITKKVIQQNYGIAYTRLQKIISDNGLPSKRDL